MELLEIYHVWNIAKKSYVCVCVQKLFFLLTPYTDLDLFIFDVAGEGRAKGRD